MSYQPDFNLITTSISRPIYDDLQYYANLTEINGLPEKFAIVTYVAEDTGNWYTWNGTTMVLRSSGTSAGLVDSVTSTGNTIIVDNTDSAHPVLSTQQEVDSLATPTFANIISTNDATLDDHVVKKLQMDNLLLNKIDAITSTSSFLLNVTAPTTNSRQLEPRIGALTQPIYTTQSGGAVNGSQISFNSGSFSTVSSCEIGFQPTNRSQYKSEIVQFMILKELANLPVKLYLVDATNNANRGVFNVSAYGTGGFSYVLTVTNISVTGTPLTSTGAEYHVYFGAGVDGSIVGTSDTQTLTNKTITSATSISSSGLITTSNNITLTGANSLISGANIERSTLLNSSISLISHTTTPVYSNISFNSYGSVQLRLPGASAWDFCNVIMPKHATLPIRSNTPRRTYVAIKLTGSSWGGVNLSGIWCGLASKQAFDLVENNFTSDFICGHNLPVWNIATSSTTRCIWGRFSGTGVDFSYGSSTSGTRSDFIADSFAAVNDIIVMYLNESTLQFTLEWYRAGALRSRGVINHPSSVTISKNNFNNGNVCGIFSCNYKGAGNEFTVMSEREMINDSVHSLITNGQNMFY